MKILFNILLVVICTTSFAQNSKLTVATEHQEAGYYEEAIAEFQKILKNKNLKENTSNSITKQLAFCYYAIHDYNKAEEYFTKYANNTPTDTSIYITYGQSLLAMNQSDKAKNFYQTHLKSLNNKLLKQLYIDNYDWILNNANKKSDYQIKVTTIKTGGVSMGISEWSKGLIVGYPQLQSDNQTVFYNLGYIKRDSLDYSEPVNLSKQHSTSYYSGYPSSNQLQNVLYYTANSSEKKKFKENKKETDYSSKGVNILKIYSIKYENNEWGEKVELPFNSNEYSTTHPSISKNGKKLYFVSNKPGGYGGYDVYQSEFKNNKWTVPINLGESINTPLDEMTPFINENILYFSSKGHLGYGGSDVYQSTIANGAFSTPKNMGKNINSEFDDFSFYLTTSQLNGYLSSNRDSEKGKDNIYEMILNSFLVIDFDTKEPIENVLVNLDADDDMNTTTTNKKGEWSPAMLSDQNKYTLYFDNPYYETKEFTSENINFNEAIKIVELKKITLSGNVVDQITKKNIEGAKVTLFEKDENDEWIEKEVKLTKEDGEWMFYIRKDKEYKIEIEKKEYMTNATEVPAINSQDPDRAGIIKSLNPTNLQIKPKKNMVLQINNIYFEYNKATLTKESLPILDNVYEFLKSNPDIKIELSAHTDCVGGDSYNLNLSTKRAKSAYIYLIKKGISKKKLVSKGYGKRKPLNPCEEQKKDKEIAAKNRRIEIKIL